MGNFDQFRWHSGLFTSVLLELLLVLSRRKISVAVPIWWWCGDGGSDSDGYDDSDFDGDDDHNDDDSGNCDAGDDDKDNYDDDDMTARTTVKTTI